MRSVMIMNKEVNIKVCDLDIHCGGVEGVGPWQFDCDKFKKLSYCLVCSNIDFDKRIKLRRLIMIIMVVQDLRRGRVQLGGNLLRRSWQANPSTSLHLHHDHHLRHHHQLHRCHDQHPNKGWPIFHAPVAMFSQHFVAKDQYNADFFAFSISGGFVSPIFGNLGMFQENQARSMWSSQSHLISDGQEIVTKIMAGTGGLVGMLVDPRGPIATYISPISRTTSILSCNHRHNCAEKHNFCIFDFIEFTTQVIVYHPSSTWKLLVSLPGWQ